MSEQVEVEGKKKKRRKKSVIFLTKELYFYKLRVYLGLEIFCLIASMLVTVPVFDNISYQILKKVGYSYLTSELMLDFFRKPLVILGTLFAFFILGLVFLWMLTMAVNILYHWEKREKCTIWHIIFSTGKRYFMLIKQKNLLFLLDAWILILFLNIPIIVWIFMQFRMPKYFLKSFLKSESAKEILIILIILVALDVILHFWELPYVILEGLSRREARKKSRKLLKKQVIRTILCVIFFQVVTIFLLLILYLTALTTSAVIVLVFIPSGLKISVFWTIHDHILIYIALIAAVMGSLLLFAAIISMYCIYKDEIKEEHNIINQGEPKDEHKKIIHKRLILLSAFILLALDIFFTYDMIYNGTIGTFDTFDTIKITAHRGSSSVAPENTIPAIEAAIQNMVDYAEIDVQLTKDGEVVLMHDNTLQRTAKVSGSISNYTYEELQEFDVGSWFSSDFEGTRIPKLSEVLELCKGKIGLNIEIKSKKGSDELEQKVIALVQQYGFQKQCVITSVYQKTLQIVKELDVDIKTGYIISSAYGNYFDDDNIDFFSMKSSFVTQGIIRRAHIRGKEVHVWTVNTKREMNRMSQLGVDNIITDVPLVVKEFLYEGDDNSTLFELLQLVLK